MSSNEEKDWKDLIGNFFQGLADLIDRAGEPIFSFIAVVVPFIAPVVIAQITATAMVVGNILNQSQADQLAYVLEGIGIVGLSGLVIAIDKWIKSNNEKMDSMIILLGAIDITYFLFLVSVNVMLDRQNPAISTTQLVIKALVCLVPLMAGGIYGYYRIIHKDKIARNEQKKEAYTIRQENREDKLKKTALENGINIFGTNANSTENKDQGKKQIRVKRKGKNASFFGRKMDAFLTDAWEQERRVPTVIEIATKFKLDYNRSKGYISGKRKKFMEDNQARN